MGLQEKKQKILERFEKDIPFFLTTMFPRSFDKRYGIPWFIRYVYHVILEEKAKRFVVAVPRKHAKTTSITFGLVMYSILMRKKKFIVIISNTTSKAIRFLERIKHYLESDPLVRLYFGRLDAPFQPVGWMDAQGSKKWNQQALRTSTGISVAALGAMSSMRGLLDLDNRPDLIIGDDIEDKNNTNTRDLREKLLDWWYEVVMELGDDGCQHIYIGTIPHHDSLICKLLENERWKPLLLRAILDSRELKEINKMMPDHLKFRPKKPIRTKRNIFNPRKYIIWEERYDYGYFLDKYLDAEQSNRLASFWQEHFNIPKSESEKIFTRFPTIDLELTEALYR